MSKKSSHHWNNIIKVVVIYGVLSGILSGLLLFGFRIITEYALAYSKIGYSFVRNNLWAVPIFFGILASIAFLINKIIAYVPSTSGGAIPLTAGIVRGILSFSWLKTLIFTMLSTLLVFLGGFPLGIEGSSVIIGTSIADGVNHQLNVRPAARQYVLTAGASSGFSFATGSLLAGIIFPLEEIHKRFSWMLLMVSMSGALFSTIVVRSLNALLSHETNFLPILSTITTLPIKYLWLALIIGIIAGLFAAFFNKAIEFFGSLFNNKLKNISRFKKILVNIIVVGIIGLLLADNLGNGHHNIIDALFLNPSHFTLLMLALLLIAKLITIIFSSSSGITGGLFVPVLVLGTLLGALLNYLLVKLGFPSEYAQAVILISMGAFFATSMDAPLTTLVFIIEASLHVETTLYIVVAIFSAMIVAHALHIHPLNEIVLKRFMKERDKDRVWKLYEIIGTIHEKSFVTGKSVRDVIWPANCIIEKLQQTFATNKTNMMVHGGDRTLGSGDQIIFQVQSYDLNESLNKLQDLVGQQTFTVIEKI